MAGLYDYNFREQNKIPVHVADKDLYRMSQPVTDYSKMVNPTQDPVKAFHQKTQDEVKKLSDARIAADQKILDERNGLRQLQEMENIAPGHPFVPRTPTPAQGYGSAEELSLAATNIDKDTQRRIENERNFTNALMHAASAEEPKEEQGLQKAYAEIENEIRQSIAANPNDPAKWGTKDTIAHETLNGTPMPNGFGAVVDSKGNVHVSHPSAWNFYGDTEAEQKWRDQQAEKETQREINDTLRNEAITARSSFVGPKRRAQAVDSMLGLQSIKQGAANASVAGLNAALNQQAALEKEGRGRADNIYKEVDKLFEGFWPEKDFPGVAAETSMRMRQDPSILALIDVMNPADTNKVIGQIAQQFKLDTDIRRQNDKNAGLNSVIPDRSILNLSTWYGFGREKPFAGGKMVDQDSYTPQERSVVEQEALWAKYRPLIAQGKITEEEAFEFINAQLIELGLPPMSRYFKG